MKQSEAPSNQSVPFAINGSRTAILDSTPTGSNSASYDVGFPAITMILKSAGGLPPLGQNINQILYELSSLGRYLSSGGGYQFTSAFSTAIGGYPVGAIVPSSDGQGYWLNTTDDNTSNPEVSTATRTGWIPAFFSGVTAVTVSGSSGVTVGTLSAAREQMVLSGTITANVTVTVPAWVKKWRIVNNCSGAFTVTVKTISGTGVAISSGQSADVIGDGTNIVTDYASGAYIGQRVFVNTGTYVPTPGTKKVKVYVTGGGGGGGGCQGSSETQTISGAGGGAGGTVIHTMTISDSSNYAITVGNGGAGAVGGGAGSSGGNSSFGGVVTAGGGSGASWVSSGITAGGAGGAAVTSVGIILQGGMGGDGQSASEFFIFTGNGGASFWGGGGRAGGKGGYAGTSYGSGGGGAYDASGSRYNGGAGAKGVVFIEEYA